jgi:hypothetical protein
MAGPIVNMLSNQRCGDLVVLGIGMKRVVPCPKPQDEHEGSEPAQKLWACPNLVENLDKH